jgi:hypothetical protein
MRSVFFHLVDVTRLQVAERLSDFADPSGTNRWNWPRQGSSPVLFLRFYDEFDQEAELEDLIALKAALGRLPDVSVVAYVSGTIPGDAQVREIAALMLSNFDGVAWDDFTGHCWTRSEIQSGALAHGHPFFDYVGWHRDSACH